VAVRRVVEAEDDRPACQATLNRTITASARHLARDEARAILAAYF